MIIVPIAEIREFLDEIAEKVFEVQGTVIRFVVLARWQHCSQWRFKSAIASSYTDVTALCNSYCVCGNCRYYVDHYNTDRKFKFRVDEMTGLVTIRNKLDVDVSRSFSLHILAVDQGKTSSRLVSRTSWYNDELVRL